VKSHWDEDALEPRGRRRRRRHPRDGERARAGEALRERERMEIEEEFALSPEERALRRAHRVAEAKTRLLTEDLWVLLICGILLLVAFPLGLVVTIVWGRKPIQRAWRLMFEEKLRDRFIQQEVEKQVHATLSEERLDLEGRHARSMEQLSASIAHEIRNPITAAKSLVQQMEEDPTSRENVEYARVALEELQRVERSVSHLLRFARDEEMGFARVRMAEVIDSALETFRDRLERSGVVLERRLEGDGLLEGDAEKLRRVVINLVTNALDAIDGTRRGSGRVAIGVGENLAGTEVWLRVADDGPGLDAEAMSRIWSPFYTSKANGTGLGLPICKKLVEAHGGMIEVTSAPEGGADFVAVFPKRRAEGGLA
jgi:signal transduction histidine kinase